MWLTLSCGPPNTEPTSGYIPFPPLLGIFFPIFSTPLFVYPLMNEIFIELLLWFELCSDWGHGSEKNKFFTFRELAFFISYLFFFSIEKDRRFKLKTM